MIFAIKAMDGSYLGHVGDSLSSRYDDAGYTTYTLETACHLDSLQEADYAFHEDGKFSKAEGAKIVAIEMVEREYVINTRNCKICDGEGKYWDNRAGELKCYCNNGKVSSVAFLDPNRVTVEMLGGEFENFAVAMSD